MKFCFFYHQNLRDNKIKQNRVTSIETDHPMIRKKIVDNYELYAKQMFFFSLNISRNNPIIVILQIIS